MTDFEGIGFANSDIEESLGQLSLIYETEGSTQLSLLQSGSAKIVATEVSLDPSSPIE